MSYAEEYERRLHGPWTDIQDHLAFLYDTVRAYESPDVVEFGVRSGESTSAILAALEDIASGHLDSVDVNPPAVPQHWFENPQWTFHQGDDLDLQAVLPPQFDVLFIDTSHTYEQTLAELRAYVPRVAPGGIVLLHDIRWLPPAISLPEPGGPVTEALNTWSTETGIPWERRHGADDGYGLGIVRIN